MEPSCQPSGRSVQVRSQRGSGGVIASWSDSRLGNTDFWGIVGLLTAFCVGPRTVHRSRLPPADSIASLPRRMGAGGVSPCGMVRATIFRRDLFQVWIARVPWRSRPSIASVKEVPNDQGGKVKLNWRASYLDVDPYYTIANYRVWRSVPEAARLRP